MEGGRPGSFSQTAMSGTSLPFPGSGQEARTLPLPARSKFFLRARTVFGFLYLDVCIVGTDESLLNKWRLLGSNLLENIRYLRM